MKTIAILLHFIISISLWQCSNASKGSGQPREIIGDKRQSFIASKDSFANPKASSLNSQGLEMVEELNFLKARKLLLSALELEPENATILNNLGLIELHELNYDLAEKYFRASIDKHPSYFKSYINFSLLLIDRKQYKEAARISEITIEYATDTFIVTGAKLNLTYALIGLGECERALQYYNELKSSNLGPLEKQFHNLDKAFYNCL